MANRPKLTPSISVEDFLDYYWLKAELLTFCRQQSLLSSGSKQELNERIVYFLRFGKRLPTKRNPSQKREKAMPKSFTRETMIASGWRCSQTLRAFFEEELGPSFHFNKVMRDFIKNEEGKTLQDAIDAWQESIDNPASKTEIDPQFEYMRHMREYFNKNPKGTRKKALQAWHEKKSQRKSSTD